MNKSLIALLCAAIFSGTVFAQAAGNPAPAGDPMAAELPAPEAVKLPALPEVVATVGDTKILGEKIEKMISKLPASVPASMQLKLRQQALSMLIFNALLENYIQKNNVKPTEADFKEINAKLEENAKSRGMTLDEAIKANGITQKELDTQAAAYNIFAAATAKDKVDALVKAHPDYFNGTEVHASHILVSCAPMAQTKDALAAYDKIKKIREDILAGKIKFDEAANKFSECPSGKRKGAEDKTEYGDLGTFPFSKNGQMMMVPTFAVAAFNTKVGQISDIVRTQFGFHIIKVIDRKEGNEKYEAAQADELAKAVLENELQMKLFDQTLNGCNVTIDLSAFEMPEEAAAPATAPAPAPAEKK